MKLNSTKGTGRHVGSNSKAGGELGSHCWGAGAVCHSDVGMPAWASQNGEHLMDQAVPQPGDSMGCSSAVRALAQGQSGHPGAWDIHTRLADLYQAGQVSPAQAMSLLLLSQVSGQINHNTSLQLMPLGLAEAQKLGEGMRKCSMGSCPLP